MDTFGKEKKKIIDSIQSLVIKKRLKRVFYTLLNSSKLIPVSNTSHRSSYEKENIEITQLGEEVNFAKEQR